MTLPTHYTEIMNTLREHYDAREQEQTDQTTRALADIRQRRKQNQDKLTEFTARYMETGVFILNNMWDSYEKPFRNNGEWYRCTMNSYAKDLAHSLKRPFVRLYSDTLILPKTKKLAVLTTPFMFVAKEYKYGQAYTTAGGGVFELTNYTSQYRYSFSGEEGLAWKQRWLEYIKEPECRTALGLLTR